LILVIRRLLAKAPAQRYQSMKEVRTDLTQVTAASATEGRPAGSRLIWSDSEAATEALSGAQPLVARIGYPRRRWLWAAAGVLAAALAGTAVWGLWSRKAPVAASLSGDDYLKATGLLDNSYRPNAVPAAQALLEKRLAADPEFALGHAALGRAYWLSYRANGDTALVDKAKRACARALQLDRNLAPPHVTLGRIYTETGQTDLATEEIQKALKLDPRSAEAYGAQAELFQKQGRNAEAEPLLEMAADLAPDDWRWPNLLALHYRNTGRLTESVKQFERLAQLTPENVSAFINLGNSYLRMEKFPEAQVAYEKSFQLQRRPQALAGLGSVLLIQGKWQEAAERFRESIDLNPSDHLGWGNLAAAYTWGQAANKAGDAYRKAIDLAEQNRVARPKDAGLLAILGGYYAATKNGQKSRRLLRQAAALDPENAEVRYRVGEGYETLGDRPQALRHLRKALSLGHSLAWVRRSPEFRQLRADPEFLSILPKAIK
jgi:tetratricopeptide (TPR) repeat protein